MPEEQEKMGKREGWETIKGERDGGGWGDR